MLLERVVLMLAWASAIFLLIRFAPRQQLREAIVVFFFKQSVTWVLGLTVVQLGLIEYPVRCFPNATAASFSFEYFIYPATCVVFVLRFPEHRSKLHQAAWYAFFPTWMTILEVAIERYTDLIEYIRWSWYATWFSLLLTFYLSRQFYLWFVRKGVPARRG